MRSKLTRVVTQLLAPEPADPMVRVAMQLPEGEHANRFAGRVARV